MQVPSGQHDEQNAIRPTKLGMKNWMFLGSEAAGKPLRYSSASSSPPNTMG